MALPPLKTWVFDQFYWPTPGEDRLQMPFPSSSWNAATGMQQYEDHLKYLRRADELGFDGICVTEHHYAPYGLPSPNLIAAVLATQTKHAKVVLMGNALPLHNPVRLAEEFAMIDVLSHGRVVAGLMRGGSMEWVHFNLTGPEARARFEESWDLIVDCWQKPDPFSWSSPHYAFENVSIMPRPIQQPHPKIVMAASTAESIEWAARKRVPMAASFAAIDSLAENFAYYREYAETECGWSPGPEYAMFSRQVYVAETDEQAHAESRPHLESFWHEIPVGRRFPPEVEKVRASQRTERSYAYKKGKAAGGPQLFESLSAGKVPETDWLIEQGMAIVGSPKSVVAQIRRQQEAFKAGTMMMYAPFGTLPMDLATKSLELYASDVLPELAKPA